MESEIHKETIRSQKIQLDQLKYSKYAHKIINIFILDILLEKFYQNPTINCQKNFHRQNSHTQLKTEAKILIHTIKNQIYNQHHKRSNIPKKIIKKTHSNLEF